MNDSTPTTMKTPIYWKKTFLTCRSPANSFYLCRTLEDVYDDTTQIRIQWYSFVDDNRDENDIDENTHFKISFEDTLDIQAILTSIPSVVTYANKIITLKKKDIVRTQRLLRKSIQTESNQTTDGAKVSQRRKRKTAGEQDAAPVRKRRRTKDVNEIDEGTSASSGKTTATKQTGVSKAKLFKVQSNRFLKENQNVTEYEVDPFFESNTPAPFISSTVQSKLAIRAVILNDAELLKSLIDDINRVYSVHIRRDFAGSPSAIHYAIKNNNIQLLEMLVADMVEPKTNRCVNFEVPGIWQAAEKGSIGTFRFRTAEVMSDRGALEGNNAFLKVTEQVISHSQRMELIEYAIRHHCSPDVYNALYEKFSCSSAIDCVCLCIENGRRDLASITMEKIKQRGRYGFNELHYQVLKFDDDELRVKRASEVTKKAKDAYQMTPIHCAAINPNAKYLKQLLTIASEVNIPDKRNRRPIHYAAVSEGTEPLEYLLSKDAKFNEVDKESNTPLHLAAMHGRHRNVEVLLRRAKEKAELNDPENQLEHEKFGLASINRKNASGHYPLHLAVINNHLKCVEILLQYGAEIDAVTVASVEKLTSLMLACRIGSLDIVRSLVINGARVEAHDRFKRTPLIHACMYGHTHVVSYLLRIGANSNVFDSSMNTALHYAIAYGWYFCVRLLMEAGANVNCANFWQLTCLGIGILKGHFGICDYLLTEHKADINFKTNNGLTVVMLPLRLRIWKTVLEQLEHVIVKHNADCTCVDINGQNAFHHLALNANPQTNSTLSEHDDSELRTYYVRVAQILLEHGCSPTQMDNKAQTPLALALESNNFIIVDFLINEAKVALTLDISCGGKTLLHYFAMNSENPALTDILAKISPIDQLRKMVEVYDNEGRTPFHYCTKRYEEHFKSRHCVDATLPKYQSMVKMIRYFLEILDCDPDIPVKRVVDHNKEASELNVTDSDMNDSNNEAQKSLRETSIFYLLYDTSYCGSANEHPLQILLKKSKNINVPLFETKRTPLLQAISAKHSKTVSLLLQNPSCDVNLATSTEISELGKAPLILACKLQYLSVIRELLNHPKCDLLLRDHQQNQAFHYFLATSMRSDEYLELFNIFIEKLMALGKDTLNSQGEAGRTPLHIAVQYNAGTVGTTYTVEEVLIENGSNVLIEDDAGNIPLHHVFLGNKITNDPVELCALVMQAMKYESLDMKNSEGNTPLHLGVMKESNICIMLLLKHNVNVSIENNLSNTPIATSIAMRHGNILITFLQQPIDVDLSKCYHTSTTSGLETSKVHDHVRTTEVSHIKPKVIKENSLITLIIKQRSWEGVLSLIMNDLHRFHLNYIQVLEAAIANNCCDIALRILTKAKQRAALHEKNSYERNLFHIIASTRISDKTLMEKCLNCLYDNKVDWNAADKYGMHPLHYACIFHNKIFIEFLLKKYSDKVDFNQKDQYGNTAYGLLFWNSAANNSIDQTFIRSIVKSGKSLDCLCTYVNELAKSPLSFGSINSSAVQSIPETPFYLEDISKIIRTTPLINAIIYNKIDIVQLLLELDADVNQSDEEKQTPLMHAVRQNSIDVAKLLLNKAKCAGDRVVSNSTHDENKDEQMKDIDVTHTEQEAMGESSTFEEATNIDLNATDALGRTCIHHLLRPLIESYDIFYANNIELFELLHTAGASLSIPDKMGFTPLKYAAKHNGCQHLYDRLRELVNECPMEIEEIPQKRFIVNDPNESLLGLHDYYSDAQKYIDEYVAAQPMKISSKVYKVDPLSKMSETADIVIDSQNNEPFDIRLTITDVDDGLIGLYNFYRMQIIKQRTKTDLYLLFTRWGRIGGGDGQHQLTPYSSMDECRAEFCKIFLEKTGNIWDDPNRFERQPKKYMVVQLKNSQTYKSTDVPIDFRRLNDETQHIPSKLESDAYKNFFKMFLSSGAIRTNLEKANLDIEWMPVSQLKTESVQRARNILAKLKTDIEHKDQLKLLIQQRNIDGMSDEQAEFKILLESICQLTNEYYGVIPLQGYGSEKLSMIDTVESVRAHAQKLDDILELELSYKILLAAQANLSRMSPLDYLYKSINCQFEALNPDDIDSQFILRYIRASAPPNTKVEQILKISRANDDERFNERNMGNRYLLWHGTNICNLISILTRGLLVEPLCAKGTGKQFGRGIYTADEFGKSLAYCSGVKKNGNESCCMLLCEVALGNTHMVTDKTSSDCRAQLDTSKYESRTAHGSSIPDPRYTIIRDSGLFL
ncbi:unnamed protein product [Rotaria socialis]|uniref:Poly [ADP-ribose] polymerase n=1 Tax=Rotaria socialis TaxID=392032 RepID=A0A819B1Z9_9BILA|nr:unnamed protein product [Rotaria socialis]CAF4848546.1 unnamed protein product [Rotaria socialis]